ELVKERADCWYVLVIADASRDQVGLRLGDGGYPRSEIGDRAVVLSPEAIGGRWFVDLEFGGPDGEAIDPRVTELGTVAELRRRAPRRAAQMDRDPLRRRWVVRNPTLGGDLSGMAVVVDRGAVHRCRDDVQPRVVAELAQQADHVGAEGLGARAACRLREDRDGLAPGSRGGNQSACASEVADVWTVRLGPRDRGRDDLAGWRRVLETAIEVR